MEEWGEGRKGGGERGGKRDAEGQGKREVGGLHGGGDTKGEGKKGKVGRGEA